MLSIKVYLKKCARTSSCMKKVCTAQMIFNSLTGDYLTSCSIYLLQKNKTLTRNEYNCSASHICWICFLQL